MKKTALPAMAVAAILAASAASAQSGAGAKPAVTGDAVLGSCLKGLDATAATIGARARKANDTRQMTADMKMMLKSYSDQVAGIRRNAGRRGLTLAECHGINALQKKIILTLASVR